jgi:protein phosphatase
LFGKRKKIERDEMAALSIQNSTEGKRKVPELVAMMHTVQGNRKYQQDNAWISSSRKILAANKTTRLMAAVCDGMGGMADGGRASETAIQMLQKGFENIEKIPLVDIPAFFRQAIVTIDRTISQFPKENGRGSGTTMVAVIAQDNQLYWASVGDSRIYLIRDGDIFQITRDHNYELRLRSMVQNGQMTQEEAAHKKQKEALISFLGIGNVSLMDVSQEPWEMQMGDLVMLCSDGVTKTLSNAQIRDILVNESTPMQDKAKILVEHAARTNTHSQDNTSVAILQYTEKSIKKER